MNEKLQNLLERYKEKTEKKCYQFSCVEGEPSILDNKIGGNPYLPVGEEYPKDKKGDWMPLLIQLNLKEIHLEGWPETGILEIFVDKKLSYPCDYTIRYFEEGLEYQTVFPEIDVSRFVVSQPIKIEVSPSICHMPISEYRFEKIAFPLISEIYENEVTNWQQLETVMGQDFDQFIDSLQNPAGTIGGYADFTQEDPRTYGNEEKSECLVKLDSNLDSRLDIGDAGILFALCSLEDIREKHFEQAIVDWDCC